MEWWTLTVPPSLLLVLLGFCGYISAFVPYSSMRAICMILTPWQPNMARDNPPALLPAFIDIFPISMHPLGDFPLPCLITEGYIPSLLLSTTPPKDDHPIDG